MITSSNSLETVVLGGNSVIETFTSNNLYSTSKSIEFSYLQIIGEIAINDTLSFTFGGNTLVFTAVATPDNSGLQIRANITQLNAAESVAVLVEDLNKNFILNSNYYISPLLALGNDYIIISSKPINSFHNLTIANTSQAINLQVILNGQAAVVRPNFNFIIEVLIEKVYNSGVFTKVISSELTPNSSQVAEFDFSSIINNYPTTSLPTIGSPTILLGNNMIKRWRYRYGERYGTTPVVYSMTESADFFVINGGFKKEIAAQKNFLSSFIAQDFSFLTNGPDHKIITTTQPEFLYYLANFASTSLTLRVKFYYKDETNSTSQITTTTSVNLNNIYIIPVDYSLVSVAIDILKDLDYYEVYLTNQNNTIVSKTIKYTVVAENSNSRYFFFKNEFGAIETIHFDGESSEGIEVSKKYFNRYLGKNYSLQDFESVSNSITSKDTYTINTGIKTIAEMDHLKEFLNSPETFELKNGVLYPIQLDVKNISLYNNSEKDLPNITLKYSSAFTNKNKT